MKPKRAASRRHRGRPDDSLRSPVDLRAIEILLIAAFIVLFFPLSGCSLARGCGSSGEKAQTIVLASTTSTDDTGLFGVLVPAFEEAHPEYRVSVVAVGTGKALALGRTGDADVLLVHSEEAEERFVAEGHGEGRRAVMYNDFVIVGPTSDPANVSEAGDSLEAMRRISEIEEVRFISRGDDSGTYIKEKELLSKAGLEPKDWHVSIGQGMGEALMMASEMQACTLSDRGTYLAMRHNLALQVLFEGDERLLNPYGVIPVSGARNIEGARVFAKWLVSDEARSIIETYGVEEHGQPLFVPLTE